MEKEKERQHEGQQKCGCGQMDREFFRLNIITILIIHVNSVRQGPAAQWEDDFSTPQRDGHQGLNYLLQFFSRHSHKHHPSLTMHSITAMINSTL
ncbi:hypothetical protein ABVT39_017439 [Epinephelus coioides]